MHFSNTGPDKLYIWRVLPIAVAFGAIFLPYLNTAAQTLSGQSPTQAVVRPIIDFQRQAVTISVPIVGVPFPLNYRSDAVAPKWRFSVYHAYDPGTGIFSPGNGRPKSVSPLFTQSAKTPQWLAIGEVAIAAQDGSEIYILNQRGDHLRTLSALTGAPVYRFDYGPAGSLTAIVDGFGNTTRIERDAAGFMTAVMAPHGQRTTFKNNDKGYPIGITNPLGETVSLDYSPDGQLAVFTEPNKDTYRFTTDQNGLLTRLQGPDGGFVDLSRTLADNESKLSWTTAMERRSAWVAQRAPDGAISAVNTDPAGSQTQMQTGTGEKTKITYPDGRTMTRVQEADPRWGRQSPEPKTLSLAMPSGLTVSLSANRTVSLPDASNPLSLASLTEVATVNGHSYKRIFDAKNRQITQITPAGRRIVTTLDEHGRATNFEVQGLFPISLTYDEQGRLASFKQGLSTDARITKLAYDANGWLASVTDPVKRTVRFEHDTAGRVTKRILPDGSEVGLQYDANGRLISITPPSRPSHSFHYTAAGQIRAYLPPQVGKDAETLTGKKSFWNSITSFLANVWKAVKFYAIKLLGTGRRAPSSPDELGPGDKSYLYDNDGQLTKVLQSGGSSMEFEHDKAGRLRAIRDRGGELSVGYDPKTARPANVSSRDGVSLVPTYDGSLLTRLDWTGPVQGSIGLGYDNNLRTSSTSVNGAPPIKLEYDTDGLLTQAGSLNLTHDLSNGLLTKTTLANVATAYDYNGFGEPVLQSTKFKDQEIFADRYERDALGRVVQKAETIDGQSTVYRYAYDLAGRLTDVSANGTPAAHYEYDPNGNRVSFTGPNGTVKATYDEQDRLQQYGSATYAHTPNGEWLTKTESGKTTTYSYDAFGNLKAVSLPDATKIDYVVDGLNRRVGKKVNGKPVQAFLYQDQLKVIAELDGANQVVSRFVYANDSNVPDYMIKGGKTYFIVKDTLGSARLVADVDTGRIAQRVDYDEFGNVLRDTNPGFQPFGFAGGIHDQHTGLMRFGARDYDALTGTWTTPEPMPFHDGGTNLYAYAFKDPINLVDSNGFEPYKSPVGPWSTLLSGIAVWNIAPAMVVGGAGVTAAGLAGGLVAAGTLGYGIGTLLDQGITAVFGESIGEALAGGEGYVPPGGTCDPSGPNPWCAPGPNAGCVSGIGPMTSTPNGGISESGSGCGRGTGDIHMETFDRLRYDFQAAGEFVATQDPAGRAKVEFRLEPPIRGSSVTVCTAFAATVEGTKVAIHLKPQPQVYINDNSTSIEPGRGMRLGQSGQIRFTEASSWIISWPDGTAARVQSEGWFLDVEVRPGSSAGKLVGLLGNADGHADGDLVTRDGTALGKDFSFKDLYGHFAESWRVSQQESLFHYAKGESTATFTDRSVPHENVTVAGLDPAARAKAEQQCRAAGISAPAALAECTIDFAMTGDRRFLASAALVQAVRPEIPKPPSGVITGGKPAGSLMVSGTGKETYNVFDSTGKQALVNYRATNSVTELLPGTYTVILNGSQQRVEVTASQQAVVRAGSLLVSGTSKETYNVLDAKGQVALVNYRPTNSVTELLPGTYTVILNGSQQRVDVTPGQQATVQAGRVMVSGTGKEAYNVFDSTGKVALVNYRATNSVTEMLPGTYSVVLNNAQQRVDVTPGQQATVQAGRVMVSGTGKEAYNVFDSTGKVALVNYRATNSVTEMLPGTYTVILNSSQQRVEITAGQQAVVHAGSLMVSGVGNDSYNVLDSTGKIDLVNYRAPNSSTEILPGTYTVVLNGSQQRIEVTPGQQAVARSGSLVVPGTGKEEYSVLDSTGAQTLATYRPVNAVTDLFPGTYIVKMGARTAKASVQAGQRTTVSP